MRDKKSKNIMAISLALVLSTGSITNPCWGMSQLGQKVVTEPKMAKVAKTSISNQNVSNLSIPGKLLKGKQKVYTKAFSAGAVKKVNGKKVALAKDKKVTIVGQKIKDGEVWYQVSFSQSQKSVTGYLPSKVVSLTLKNKVKATINSSKKVTVKKGASNKQAAVKQSGKTVSIKKGTEVLISKEKNTAGVKWYQVSFTYNNKKVSGYIDCSPSGDHSKGTRRGICYRQAK